MPRTRRKPPGSDLSSRVKRFVCVTGNKGGTGKSMFARFLLDRFRFLQLNCTAYDCDTENSHLFRHYQSIPPGVNRLAISEDEGIDQLVDALQVVDTPLALMDLPAQIGKVLEKLEAEVGILDAMGQTGHRMTFVSVLSPIKDSVIALKLLMGQYGNQVDYVVVLNHFFEEPFTLYETSETRSQLLEFKGIEISMPKLYAAVSKVISEKDLGFRAALMPEASDLSFSQRVRLERWIKTMDAEVCKAAVFLGLPTDV